MKCYIMFCVANLMQNMMTLFKIYHRNTLSSISVNLLQLRHVSNKICFAGLIGKQRRHSYADWKSSMGEIFDKCANGCKVD